MAVRVGRWDCTTCGTKGIYGPETRCPNCGAARPEDVRFYLPSEAELVTDEARLREARAGVDWICGHCRTQNKAADTRCVSCDNPRDDISEDVALTERTYGLDEVPTDSFAPKRTLHPDEIAARQPRRRTSPLRWLLYAALVVLVGYVLLRAFPRSITVTIADFAWERQIQMLHHEAVSQEAWQVPSGAFEVESFRAVREYKQVLRGYETRTRTVQVKVGEERYVCGQIDKGNGYFVDKYCTRPIYENREETYEAPVYDQVPVYDTKYRFKVMKWVAHERNLLKASGQDHQPRWPDLSRYAGQSDWKEGSRQGTYTVIVREDDGDIHREVVGPRFWEGLQAGQGLRAKRSWLFDMYYGLDEPGRDQ